MFLTLLSHTAGRILIWSESRGLLYFEGALQQLVYRQKIEDVDHLKQVLNSCWDMISQELIESAIELWSKPLSSIVCSRDGQCPLDTSNTVSFNSGNWFWCELCFIDEFVKKMLLLMLPSNSSLANCKPKNTQLRRRFPLSCKQPIFGHVVENRRLCNMWLQKCGAANFVPFFLQHPTYMNGLKSDQYT